MSKGNYIGNLRIILLTHGICVHADEMDELSSLQRRRQSAQQLNQSQLSIDEHSDEPLRILLDPNALNVQYHKKHFHRCLLVEKEVKSREKLG